MKLSLPHFAAMRNFTHAVNFTADRQLHLPKRANLVVEGNISLYFKGMYVRLSPTANLKHLKPSFPLFHNLLKSRVHRRICKHSRLYPLVFSPPCAQGKREFLRSTACSKRFHLLLFRLSVSGKQILLTLTGNRFPLRGRYESL